jgi:hypothetical protein
MSRPGRMSPKTEKKRMKLRDYFILYPIGRNFIIPNVV